MVRRIMEWRWRGEECMHFESPGRSVRVCLEGRVASDWVEIRLGRCGPGAQAAPRVDRTRGVA